MKEVRFFLLFLVLILSHSLFGETGQRLFSGTTPEGERLFLNSKKIQHDKAGELPASAGFYSIFLQVPVNSVPAESSKKTTFIIAGLECPGMTASSLSQFEFTHRYCSVLEKIFLLTACFRI